MKKKHFLVFALAGVLAAGTAAWAAPFGGPDDVKYSQALWKALVKAKLAGPGSIKSTPYTVQHPHGAVLEAIDSTIKVKGTTGAMRVQPGEARSFGR